jgi:hypothetical protein
MASPAATTSTPASCAEPGMWRSIVLGYAAHSLAELDEAVRRLAALSAETAR